MKTLIRRVCGRFYGKQYRYRPQMTNSSLLDMLARHTQWAELMEENFLVSARSSEAQDAARRAVRLFRSRNRPKFFLDPAKIRVLAIECPPKIWRERTLQKLEDERELGLEIYEMSSPPLRPGFPWACPSRDPDADPLYARRPHRFAFAPRWALAALYGAPVLPALTSLLEEWMSLASSRHSELPYGSNLIVVQRFLALSWAWALIAAREELDSEDGLAAELAILKILRADACFLESRLDKSVGNNHRLADCFAAWYIALQFPELLAAPEKRIEYEQRWLKELQRQTYRDGTGFEHSVHYHEYACELTAAYVLLSRRNDSDVPAWVLERLERMLRFQVDLASKENVAVAIGDATEDPMFPLDTGQGCGTGFVRELYRALFRPDFPPTPEDDPSVERAFWLLGGRLAPSSEWVSPEESFRAYPDGGYFLFGEDCETRLIFRTGPAPGENLWAGHMHADLFSIYLHHYGEPLIVDSGTYTYRSRAKARRSTDSPPWRAYFAGPAAHNGLVIDGEDPLGPLRRNFRGPETSTRVAARRQLAHPLAAWVEGELVCKNSYGGYRRGVVHIRGKYWLIYDVLPTSAAGTKCWFGFQLAPEARVDMERSQTASVTLEGRRICIAWSGGIAKTDVVCGSTAPLGGWISPQYGKLVTAPQLRFHADRSSTLTAFVLHAGTGTARPVHVQAAEELAGGLAFRIDFEDVVDTVVLHSGATSAPLSAWGLNFDGVLLWTRQINGRLVAVRCLEGRRITSRRHKLEVSTRDGPENFELLADGREFVVRHARREDLLIAYPSRPGAPENIVQK